MLVKEWVDVIENLYDFSQRLGQNPRWVEEGHSFEENLEYYTDSGTAITPLRVIRHLLFLELTTKYLDLKSLNLDEPARDNLLRHFLEQNLNVEGVVYFALDDSVLFLTGKIVLSPDMEATLGHYLMVRNTMVNILSRIDAELNGVEHGK